MFRSLAMRRVTSWPPIHTRPASGSWKPAIMRRVVVLPHPEGPRRVSSSPGRTSRLTSRTAYTSPLTRWWKRLDTASSRIATGGGPATGNARDLDAARGLEPAERPADPRHHDEDDGDHENREGCRRTERELRHVLEDA